MRNLGSRDEHRARSGGGRHGRPVAPTDAVERSATVGRYGSARPIHRPDHGPGETAPVSRGHYWLVPVDQEQVQ
jgi:hypothetical protein